jgi:hypothetical protein
LVDVDIDLGVFKTISVMAGGGIVMAASGTIGLLGSVMAAEKSRLSPSGDLAAACKNVAVLFDFDGTLGDTETPAMEVEFQPYPKPCRIFPKPC